jgi:hypothetical protein
LKDNSPEKLLKLNIIDNKLLWVKRSLGNVPENVLFSRTRNRINVGQISGNSPDILLLLTSSVVNFGGKFFGSVKESWLFDNISSLISVERFKFAERFPVIKFEEISKLFRLTNFQRLEGNSPKNVRNILKNKKF